MDKLIDRFDEKISDILSSDSINNQKEFDLWHKETCEWFLCEYQDLLDRYGVNYIMQFGKAQKALNMSLKNRYGTNGYQENWQTVYQFCHVPLDNYIRNWYNRNVARRGERWNTAWSNLQYEEYADIQEKIKDYLKSNSSEIINAFNVKYEGKNHAKICNHDALTRFEAELYIWYSENG